MTTTIKNVEILTTLDEDPHVSFYPWEMDIHDIASGMAKLPMNPTGLLAAILTDEQWAAYPGNTRIDPQGQAQIAARFVPAAHIDINLGMTNVELYVAKASNDRLQVWIDALEALKRAVIKSLGRVVRQIVRDPRIRFQQLSVPDIITRVRARYGRMQKDIKQNLKDRMTTILPTADGLDTHISNLTDLFDVSATAGYPISETDKLDIFRDTVTGHPIIVKVIETFDFDFPDARQTTYDQLTAYLIVHVPNLRHTQLAATRVTANLVAATAYSTLEAESKRLKAENEKLKRKRTPTDKGKGNKKDKKGKGKGKGARNAASGARDGDTETLKYCHGHGYQRSHTSSECKLLAGDKKFNAAMKAATGPNHPPGGSTKVNGQASNLAKPRHVTANIAHQIRLQEGEEEDSYDDVTQDDYEETTAFLTSVINDQNGDSPIHVTAMMMGDDALLLDENVKSEALLIASPEEIRLWSQPQIVNANIETNLSPNEIGLPPNVTNLATKETILSPNETNRAPKETNLRPHETNRFPKKTILNPNETDRAPKETNLRPHETNLPSKYTLITDGSLFQLSFWDAECQFLQTQIQRQLKARRLKNLPIPPRRIPTAEELQGQYVTWLLEQPAVPLLSSPLSSGFYSAVWGFDAATTPYEPARAAMEGSSSATGFYDDEYVEGKRVIPTLNPAQRTSPTYQSVLTAQLTTIAEILRHEERIYHPGYTPTAIRANIVSMLNDSDPDQHMVDFQDKDIPPLHRDPSTHQLLTNLLRKRNRLDRDFQLSPESVAADGTALDTNERYEEEYTRRNNEYNRVNRKMYLIYAASAYVVHDRNFLSYCRPALRNLPVATAYKLAKLKTRLSTPNTTNPPYQTIQEPSRTQTQPIFSALRPSYADVLRPPLHPRAEWMKTQPPYMSDEEADNVWHQSNQATFPKGVLTDAEIQNQIDILKKIQDQRLRQPALPSPHCHDKETLSEAQDEQLTSTHNLESRVFRQGRRTPTPDKNRQTSSSQSAAFQSTKVQTKAKKVCPKEKSPRMDQSGRPSQSNVSVLTENDLANRVSGQKTTTTREFSAEDEEDASDDDGMHPEEREMWSKLLQKGIGKYEAASIIQPRPAQSSAAAMDASNEDSGDATTGWPSETGMRRGKPKRDYNQDGTRKAVPKHTPDYEGKEQKRKKVNDFGQDTFWNRPARSKRKPTPESEALAAISTDLSPHNLIVDTGASHVLFQHKHMDLLRNVVLSQPQTPPFAVLRAANGQILTAIGKGIFQVKHISVIAYIFKNEDLVHNLLGIAPFADCGCKAVFTAQDFNLYHKKDLILTGRRHSANLWHISLNGPATTYVPAATVPADFHSTKQVLLLHEDTRRDAKYVQFMHACFGSPPPVTFLNAINRGYLSGENQFPRLTAKMIRRNMPNSEATARGHLTKTPTAQPHSGSQSVSAQLRAFVKSKRQSPAIKMEKPKDAQPKGNQFDATAVPRSTTIHLDYTGRLPARGSAGTLYYLIACWGSYIHLEPLKTMKGAETAAAITSAVRFFRDQLVDLTTIRMDNQSSPEVRQAAKDLKLEWDLVNPYQKEPNRAERAIRTAKNHMIAVRAGFHPDCPTSFMDRCLFQIELTLNLLHPFEYHPGISAHHGLFRKRFDFSRHPIAPIGTKVLTWDSPETRGSWADHGVSGMYLGPAMRHFRGFNIWVPQNCAARVSGTVWWFLKPFVPDDDLLSPDNTNILYPPSRERLLPSPDGADLLGRCFMDPSIGVCCITQMGPMADRNDEASVPTLHYRCLNTQAEFYASVEQIANWIQDGPLLKAPVEDSNRAPAAPVTYPPYAPSRFEGDLPLSCPPTSLTSPPATGQPHELPSAITAPEASISPPNMIDTFMPRRSKRKRRAPDFLRPKFHGKVYLATAATHLCRKQRVPAVWEFAGKQRVTLPEAKRQRVVKMKEESGIQTPYQTTFWKYRELLRRLRNQRTKWWFDVQSTSANVFHINTTSDIYERPMPTTNLPPIFPDGPLNLNPDGTAITYRKSHQGPNAEYWHQADAEEMERLFRSGTLRPIMFKDIPENREATYVNPVCSEKTKDDGALKFRTRATIGGDRIDYPYTTTAITAELESIKLLLNAMISDNAAFSTVDLEDFYLGTDLPHPEFIRIPVTFIPQKVLLFYLLEQFIHKGALYCMVLKTHYGLPQAGALSQARLFAHLERHGYYQLFHAPALFRNTDGTIRFALVVDDFAVVWSSKKSMKHFLQTLRKLYTVKVDYQGSRYLGMDISIDRKNRHVTLAMPGYIAKLLKRVRPNGVKGARTPSTYTAPNYQRATSQAATVDSSPLASAAQQKELQVIVGTLLYYARSVDPSILTAVHELGSVQAKPSLNDMRKMERLLQYVSVHQNQGIRFHASNMQLQIQSDASYLSRTKARSVLGGLHYLGTTVHINGPFFCTSKLISCIVTSAAEAELGAAFQNAQKGAQFRNTLVELGYPQHATPLLVDNTVAEGLASDTITARRSKSMDVRFFWLRDRVKKGQFLIKHIMGRWNIADFFTKSLPTDKFEQFCPLIIVVLDPKSTTPTRHTVVMNKML